MEQTLHREVCRSSHRLVMNTGKGNNYHQQQQSNHYPFQLQHNGPLLPLPTQGQMAISSPSTASSSPCPNYKQATSKSDMCLINELVRGLSIRHEYRLVSESGPAHKKMFTVNLKLGDLESYEGSGPSIKKAQQAAASRALKETKLSHSLASRKAKKSSSTPTVELNVYAMKQGLQVNYVVNEPRILMPDGTITGGGPYHDPGGGVGQQNQQQSQRNYPVPCCPYADCSPLSPSQSSTSSSWTSSQSSFHSQSPSYPSINGSTSGRGRGRGRGGGHWNTAGHQQPSQQPWELQPGQRYMSTTTNLYEAIVTVGNCQYFGSGRTPQGARHSAAQAALDSIYSSGNSSYGGSSSYSGYLDDGSSQASTSSMSSSISSNMDGGGNQRPVIVSLLKRASELNLIVNFEVIQNLGPSHLPTFITQCTAGRFVVQSQGHSKKESKKRAASDMLALLNQIKIVPNGQIAPSHGQQMLAAAAAMPSPVMVPNGHHTVQVLNGGAILTSNGQLIHSPPPAIIPTHHHLMTPSSGPIISHHSHFTHQVVHGHPAIAATMSPTHVQNVGVQPQGSSINVVQSSPNCNSQSDLSSPPTSHAQ